MGAKKPPTEEPAWKVFALFLFGVYMFWFSGYNLYEWYNTGQIYLHTFGKPEWGSFSDEPIYFSLIATVYATIFFLLGVGSIAKLINWLKRK